MSMQDQRERDELARRRQMREQGRNGDGEGDLDDNDEEMPKFTWSDTFAMIIAAYQVLLPMLLAMIGVMVAAYFLFRLIFS
jgi:type II secretory pathway component PulF